MRQSETHPEQRNDELWTLQEVADFLKLAPRTIHRYRSSGEFCEPVKLAGRTPRWWRSSIIRWANGEISESPD